MFAAFKRTITHLFFEGKFCKGRGLFSNYKIFSNFFSKIIFYFVKSISIFLIDRCHIVCFSKASAKVGTFNETTKYFLVFFLTIFRHIPPTSYNTTNYDIKKYVIKHIFLKSYILFLYEMLISIAAYHSII